LNLQASISFTALKCCDVEAKKRLTLLEKARDICLSIQNKLVFKKERRTNSSNYEFTLLDYVGRSKNCIPNTFKGTLIGDIVRGKSSDV